MCRTAVVSNLVSVLDVAALAVILCLSSDSTLSTLISSSFGFLRITSSVGVSGDIGIAEVATSVIPRSWSATAFRGLSAPDEGAGLPRGGVVAGRSAVFSNGIAGVWSRLRFGDG